MKLNIIITMLLALNLTAVSAQDSSKTVYPVVVSFESICCGVPTETTLLNFIKAFKQKNKLNKIAAFHIGPMGREGEYYIAFPLKDMSRKQASKFTKEIRKLTKLPDDKGQLTIREKYELVKANLPARAKMTKLLY